MRILVTGVGGQLGFDLIKALQERGEECLGTDLEDFDITNASKTNSYILDWNPDAVIHCSAYTAVDKAEEEPEYCYLVNVVGSKNIAAACRKINAKLIYISTDYVFSGMGERPYTVDDPAEPLSVYGKSKLAGEFAVRKIVDKLFIIRTSWVYGENGNNFVKTMLRIGKERDSVNVVCDQIGSPTYSADLASLLCDMVVTEKYGTYHATNEGFCSWSEFAQEIFSLSNTPIRVNPILTSSYPTKAVRPLNSRLSKDKLDVAGFSRLPNWKISLKKYLDDTNEIE